MPELRFAIAQQQKSALTDSIYGPLTQVLATLAVLAEGLLTQASIQTPFSGWMTKPAHPVWRLGVTIDPGINKAACKSWPWRASPRSLHSFIHSLIHWFRCVHIYDRDLPQSFQVARLIDNTMHTSVLKSHAQVHLLTVFLIQQSWVINFGTIAR